MNHSEGEVVVDLDRLQELFEIPSFSLARPGAPRASGIERAVTELAARRRRELHTLVLRMPSNASVDATAPDLASVHVALRSFCLARAMELHSRADATRRTGWWALRIAILLLALCLGCSAALEAFQPLPRLLNRLFTEGLVIAGWVVLWRPLDILIFEVASPRIEAKCYEHLASMRLQMREIPAAFGGDGGVDPAGGGRAFHSARVAD